MTHLKVAVRVRPMSQREIGDSQTPIIQVEDKNVVAITNLKVPEDNAGDSRDRVRRFSFDFCFSGDATQSQIFDDLSPTLAPALRSRQNCCVLAYGQSASGKTHTMFGNESDPGLAPRLCTALFDYLKDAAVGDEIDKLSVLVSYLEIYNEKVTDLLRPEGEQKEKGEQLRIREHPKKGPYVQGLTEHTASEPSTLLKWLEAGTNRRRSAATPRNPRSSRSHAVLRLSCAGARLNLVDLAGSEKAIGRCYSRFREGANINKSLVALGNVISALGEPSAAGHRRHHHQQTEERRRNPPAASRPPFVPFRDSALTWLLRDTLAGDSNTLLVATVSPAGGCHAESLNTLRFGQRARRVVARPPIAARASPADRIVQQLREEVARLREQLRLVVSQQLTPPPLPRHAMSDNSPDLSELSEIDNSESSSGTYITGESKDTKITQNEPKVRSTETLVTPLKFSDTVKPKVTTLRRTFSVDRHIINNKMNSNNDNSRSFSSQESLQSPKHSKRKSLPSLKNSATNSPRDSLSGQSNKGKNSSSTSSSTQQSPVRKKTTTVTLNNSTKTNIANGLKTIVQKRMLDNTSKKSGSDTNLNKSSVRKPISKPRAQIVAAVTSRLYNKANKREVGTETDPIDDRDKNAILKEAAMTTNARMKLMEFTQRALKATRRKHVETQTQLKNFPVKRVKEAYTDCNDLELEAKIVRNEETMTKIETSDQSVDCIILDDPPESKNISTQCDCLYNKNVPLNFGKYLTYSSENPPIYAETVNINISHNYASVNRLESVSNESLHQNIVPNANFPTPDLISNHNSLEQHNEEPKIRFGMSRAIQEEIETNSMFASENKSYIRAKSTLLPILCKEKTKVTKQMVYATEIYVADQCKEKCDILKLEVPQYVKVIAVICHDILCENCVIINEPIVRKSIIKSSTKTNSSSSGSDEDISTFPDSLEYHKANSKKVKFRNKKSCNHNRMQKAMSNFLEEASTLIYHLTSAATKLENSSKQSGLFNENFELQISLSDIPDLTKFQSTQNDNTSDKNSIAINKYEALLQESCARLEDRINKTLNKQSNVKYRQNNSEEMDDGRFAQPLSFHPWNLEAQEDSSLESNPMTFSDYGSLPRRSGKRLRTTSSSPSAFLRQLAGVRRQIVESSREDLLESAPRE